MKADRIFIGNVVTGTGRTARAVATFGTRILYVGSIETASAFVEQGTEIVDLGEAYIYPGMMDAHTHGPMAGMRLAYTCEVPQGPLDRIVETMGEYVKANPGRSIYMGAGWVFDGTEPDASMLDAICPDVPLYINTADGHSMWLNSKAMEVYGIDEEAVKEYGPEMVHTRPDGSPSGMVSETPAMDILMASMDLSYEEYRECFLAWQDFALAHGLTGTTLAGVMNEQEADYLHRMDVEGDLKLRTFGLFILSNREGDPKARVHQAREVRARTRGDHFEIVGIKAILDGVVEAKTAWLLEPYTDTDYHGEQMFTDLDDFADAIAEANRWGLLVHCHAIGDGALRFAVDAMEQAQKSTGIMDPRNAVCHLQVCDPSDIERMGDLNIQAVVPPLWVPKDETFYPLESGWLGPDRAYKDYPIKSFYDAGCNVAFHTDFPVTPIMDNPHAIYDAMQRNAPTFPDCMERRPSEGITGEQCLDALTIGCARTVKMEEELGTIEIGKLADMTVYDRPIIPSPGSGKSEKLRCAEAKLVATIIDGEIVYHAEE